MIHSIISGLLHEKVYVSTDVALCALPISVAAAYGHLRAIPESQPTDRRGVLAALDVGGYMSGQVMSPRMVDWALPVVPLRRSEQYADNNNDNGWRRVAATKKQH